jgi:hypothetical protein
MLILDDTPKGATAVVAGIDDPGPRAIRHGFLKKRKKKSRLSFVIRPNIGGRECGL